MLRRVPGLLAVLVPLALAPAAAAQTPLPTPTPTPAPSPAPEERRVAPGVRAGGLDLSNLTIPEATARLRDGLSAQLARNVSVRVAGRAFRISMRRIRFAFDPERTAKRAERAGRATPPPPEGLDVPLAVTFRRAPIRDFANSIDGRVYLKPRDATVKITVRRVTPRRSHSGRDLDATALRALIEATIVNPAAPRVLKPGRKVVPAKVQVKDLARAYGTVITIDRNSFTLRLFKRLKLSKSYRIAVGAAGYDTPSGRYRIQNKAVNPPWSAPNKPWAGLYAGRTVPGGAPDNPLKARWLGIANGVGIHGTGIPGSIGTRASHGCIRMTVPDVIDLYPRVPVGTPVLIS
jgi:lipoprotein-anchoring transpeptidase ErfK/SrfK